MVLEVLETMRQEIAMRPISWTLIQSHPGSDLHGFRSLAKIFDS